MKYQTAANRKVISNVATTKTATSAITISTLSVAPSPTPTSRVDSLLKFPSSSPDMWAYIRKEKIYGFR
jgi:hypothetical protein